MTNDASCSCCGGDDHHHHHGHPHHDHHHEGHADLSGPAGSPILVEVTRGGMVESVHHGRAVVVDAGGRILARWGDVAAPVFARSSVKALQAIPLIESGAFDAYGLGDEELALACSSHNGEPRHVDLVLPWLDRIGCTVDDLECGPQLPYDPKATHDVIRAGGKPEQVYNNCSGKHAGFLTVARHKGEPTRGYVRYDHPVQQRILGVLEQMTGQDLSRAPWGVDGCAIPTIAMPLEAVAYAMARIADPRDLPDQRAEAVTRIRKAWAAHPYLIAGRETFDTAVMQALPGEVVVKSGAEGFGVALFPAHGVAVALKVDDGGGRARDVALAAVIRATGLIDDASWARAAPLLTVPVTNRNGAEVGVVRPAPGV